MKLVLSILTLALVAAGVALLWPRGDKNFTAEVSLNDTAPTITPTPQRIASIVTPTATTTQQLTTSTNTPALRPPTVVPASALAATATPATITRGSNNQIEVDGRYTILGSGTELDPYRVTWELLKSAYETMDLNGSRTTPPKRLEMLNGTYVQSADIWRHLCGVKKPRNCLSCSISGTVVALACRQLHLIASRRNFPRP